MSIYGALTTAVSGLKAQASALANISGNIANSQTTGYKRMETSFRDLISEAPVGRQIAGAVQSYTRSTNDVRGDVIPSSVSTHVALNGSGYFLVAGKTGAQNGVSQFGQTYYTRRGDFELDRDGYLVNGAGYHLQGVQIENGVPGTSIGVIKVNNQQIEPKRSERIDYQLNLPGRDDVAAGAAIDGGSLTLYTPKGTPTMVELQWQKTSDTPDTWQLRYQDKANGNAWTDAGNPVTFDQAGQRTSPTGPFSVSIPAGNLVDPDLVGADAYMVRIEFGAEGLTQHDNGSAQARIAMLEQNGYPSGDFMSVAIDDSGRVIASYTNGEQIPVFQLVTANFSAENMLKRSDGGIYSETAQSGGPSTSLGGPITGSALEASNTEISEEFTKLITTQQAYSAATRIVSTSDEMMQETLNMIR